MRREWGRPGWRPGLDTQHITTATSGMAIIADPPVVVDYLVWRCRRGQCVDRPLHDCMDWWPSWSLESRWSA